MLIDRINLNHLRMFERVYKQRSMTLAAQELHLTQSGVSQHMRALETDLGVKLFDRVRQKLIPTEAANKLYGQISQDIASLEQVLWEVTGKPKELSGSVAIGMPVEFGYNVLVPALAEISTRYPLINFKIELGLADTLSDPLFNGVLDFAFVDDYAIDRRLDRKRVYDEPLELCYGARVAKKLAGMNQKPARALYESLEYVTYDEDQAILRKWFNHHMRYKNLNFNVRAVVSDAALVKQLIVGSDCVGVLPGHLVDRLREEGSEIHTFPGSGKPLSNQISIASLKERTLTAACTQVMDDLLAVIAGL